jgi:hypothetical protein
MEAVASAGRGVVETFKLISKLLRRLTANKPGALKVTSLRIVRLSTIASVGSNRRNLTTDSYSQLVYVFVVHTLS